MIRKHSLTIRGHRTSVSVEDPFWEALTTIAADRGCSVATLVGRIDEKRPEDVNLSSAVRLFVLAEVQAHDAGGVSGKLSRD